MCVSFRERSVTGIALGAAIHLEIAASLAARRDPAGNQQDRDATAPEHVRFLMAATIRDRRLNDREQPVQVPFSFGCAINAGVRVLVVEDQERCRRSCRRADRGRLRRGSRRGRRAGGLPRRDREYDARRARPRPAAGRRPDAAAQLARGRQCRAGARAHRPRQLAREGPGHRQRRRRLRGQAVPDGGGAGAAARADPARQRPGHAAAAVRRVSLDPRLAKRHASTARR